MSAKMSSSLWAFISSKFLLARCFDFMFRSLRMMNTQMMTKMQIKRVLTQIPVTALVSPAARDLAVAVSQMASELTVQSAMLPSPNAAQFWHCLHWFASWLSTSMNVNPSRQAAHSRSRSGHGSVTAYWPNEQFFTGSHDASMWFVLGLYVPRGHGWHDTGWTSRTKHSDPVSVTDAIGLWPKYVQVPSTESMATAVHSEPMLPSAMFLTAHVVWQSDVSASA